MDPIETGIKLLLFIIFFSLFFSLVRFLVQKFLSDFFQGSSKVIIKFFSLLKEIFQKKR